jgi:hypothetical protein
MATLYRVKVPVTLEGLEVGDKVIRSKGSRRTGEPLCGSKKRSKPSGGLFKLRLRENIKGKNLVARWNYIAVLFAAAIFFIVHPALAHPKLTATVPPADALAQSPQEIRLSFSEALVSKFSGLDLKNQDGKRVETGPATSNMH